MMSKYSYQRVDGGNMSSSRIMTLLGDSPLADQMGQSIFFFANSKLGKKWREHGTTGNTRIDGPSAHMHL